MIYLSLVPINNHFIIEVKRLEKALLKNFIKIGLVPNGKFKVYSKDFFGGVVVGNEFFKVALGGVLAKKLMVSYSPDE